MKKSILLFALLSVGTAAHAQITVTDADIAPAGSDFIIFTDSTSTGLSVDAPTGAAQSWDFSALQYDDWDTLSLLNPSTVTSTGSFPTATHAIDEGGDFYTFLKLDNSGLYLDGVEGDLLDQGVNVSFDVDPDLAILSLPANFGDSYSSSTIIDSTLAGSQIGQPVDSARITREITFDGEVDAYGTVTTPSGMYDVLRVYTQEITSDVTEILLFGTWTPVAQSSDTIYRYSFIANNEGYYVLEVETDGPNGNVLYADYKTGANLQSAVDTDATSCYGSADGEAAAFGFGGSGTYTFNWSDGTANGNEVSGLAAGSYSVTVSDGVTDVVETFTIIEPDSITLNANISGASPGANDGSIAVTASGGTPGYDFVWSNGGTTALLQNLTTGTYSVTVTDDEGCQKEATYEVPEATSLEDLTWQKSINLHPNPSKGKVRIRTGQGITVESIAFINSVGAVLRFENALNESLELELPEEKGIYFLRMQTNKGTVVKRIVRQ